MSFTDRLILWLHVAFVIFTIGPVTIAALASPRYIRKRNPVVLRYLLRTTTVFGAGSLGVLVFGIVAAQQIHKLGSAWVTVSITLFVVALVLLVLIMRDQRRAAAALEASAEQDALVAASSAPPGAEPPGAEAPGTAAEGRPQANPQAPTLEGPNVPLHTANVERGRIASMAGIVTLIWLAILVLMIWNANH
jgi:hypothetical protein